MNLLKQSTRNVAVNIGAKFIMLLLPFAIRSVMLYTLGTLYLGVDNLFASILNMLSLSELGFSSAIVFSMYKPVAEHDDRTVRALLAFYKKVYLAIGCIILTLGLALLPFLDFFIAEGTKYPAEINIYLVYIVLLVNTSLSYLLFAYKNAILVATMRNDIDALLDLLRSVVSHGLQIFVLIAFQSYYLYIIVLPIITVLNNIVRKVIIDKRYPQYLGKERLNKDIRKDILLRVGALVGNKVGGVVFTSVDSIVISSFLGLDILGKYSNYYMILTAVYAVFSTGYTAIQSTVGNCLVSRNKDENYRLFKKLYAGNAVLTCLCTCCFCFLYQPFMQIWVGETNMLGIEIVVLLAAYYYVKSTRRICFLFKEAAGMWCETWLMPYISVAANLALNILLVKFIGLPGVLISSILALVLIEIPWETTVFFRKYFKRSMNEYIKAILYSAFCTVVALTFISIFVYWLEQFILNIFIKLIYRLCVCFLITLIIYFRFIKSLVRNRV